MAQDSPPYPFWPQQIGAYESELGQLLVRLEGCDNSIEASQRVTQHLSLCPEYPGAKLPLLRYRAYLLVLRDLLLQGWVPTVRASRLYVSPPSWTQAPADPTAALAQKQAIRQAMSHERVAQLRQPTVRAFIARMERPRAYQNRVVSIRNLIASGAALSAAVERAVAQPDDEMRRQTVGEIVQPYLQLVTPQSRCGFTGLRLLDVWRYLRYTWAIPYRATPGRTMYYLVRDSAQSDHPIIGIAALGSSLMQITPRDDAIGWTPKAMRQRLCDARFSNADAATIARMLRATLRDALDDIATDDLLELGELESPTSATLARLEQCEVEARSTRIAYLQQSRLIKEDLSDPFGGLDLLNDKQASKSGLIEELNQRATEALFRSKRSKVLRILLAAKIAISEATQNLDTAVGLLEFFETEQGSKAVRTLIRENKKRRVGINMMDIIVCGAIPPYNLLLGGKLVAMLMASPQIVREYKHKYLGQISHIASKMKGGDVHRVPELVFLGTTSLYHVGSSQYNRVSIPIFRSNDAIKYSKLGKTLGFGSVHFSEETVNALDNLRALQHGATLINNRFGEGVNPRLRRVSAGLAAIGLSNIDRFTKHRSKRIVYGVELGARTCEFLRGETDDPKVYFDSVSEIACNEANQYIVQHWIDRWLLKRVQRPEILEVLANFYQDDFLLSISIERDSILAEELER